jgi:hypothetical protein
MAIQEPTVSDQNQVSEGFLVEEVEERGRK